MRKIYILFTGHIYHLSLQSYQYLIWSPAFLPDIHSNPMTLFLSSQHVDVVGDQEFTPSCGSCSPRGDKLGRSKIRFPFRVYQLKQKHVTISVIQGVFKQLVARSRRSKDTWPGHSMHEDSTIQCTNIYQEKGFPISLLSLHAPP